jgi:hypothetical protein
MEGVVSFRDYGKCIYLAEGEVFRIYRPQSMRRFGATLLGGDIGFVLRSELPAIEKTSRSVPRAPSLSVCSLMNLPHIVALSALNNGGIALEFVAEVGRYVRALPTTQHEIDQAFGPGFLNLNALQRIPIMSAFLRALPAA